MTLLGHRAGSGEPLVLLHGLGVDWRSWSPVLPALEARHDVLALDLPGHGAAAKVDGRHSIAALADAVEAQLDALGLERPHVAGNSVGGRVAVELAVRQRARTLVAISPSGLETPPERAWVFAADQALRARARVAAPARRRLSRRGVMRTAALAGPHVRPWRLSPADAAHELERIATTRAYQSTLWWGGMADRPRGLDRITCPARIAFGTLDVLLGALTAPRWAAAIPTADLVPFPRCGHAPMADDPDLVARTILDVTARAGV